MLPFITSTAATCLFSDLSANTCAQILHDFSASCDALNKQARLLCFDPARYSFWTGLLPNNDGKITLCESITPYILLERHDPSAMFLVDATEPADWIAEVVCFSARHISDMPMVFLYGLPDVDRTSPYFQEYLIKSLGKTYEQVDSVLMYTDAQTYTALKAADAPVDRPYAALSFDRIRLLVNEQRIHTYRQTLEMLRKQWLASANMPEAQDALVEDGIVAPEIWFDPTLEQPRVMIVVDRLQADAVNTIACMDLLTLSDAAEAIYRHTFPQGKHSEWLGTTTAAKYLRKREEMFRTLAVIALDKRRPSATHAVDAASFMELCRAQVRLIAPGVIVCAYESSTRTAAFDAFLADCGIYIIRLPMEKDTL